MITGEEEAVVEAEVVETTPAAAEEVMRAAPAAEVAGKPRIITRAETTTASTLNRPPTANPALAAPVLCHALLNSR